MTTIPTVFEVNAIIDDKICDGETYYCVSWKNSTTKDLNCFGAYKKDMKNVVKIKGIYIIYWEETWMSYEELKDTCDEILGAYLLLKLYNYSVV